MASKIGQIIGNAAHLGGGAICGTFSKGVFFDRVY